MRAFAAISPDEIALQTGGMTGFLDFVHTEYSLARPFKHERTNDRAAVLSRIISLLTSLASYGTPRGTGLVM